MRWLIGRLRPTAVAPREQNVLTKRAFPFAFRLIVCCGGSVLSLEVPQEEEGVSLVLEQLVGRCSRCRVAANGTDGC